MNGKAYKMLIEIAGKVDASVDKSISSTKSKLMSLDKSFQSYDKVYDKIAGGVKKVAGAVAAASVPAAIFTKQMIEAGSSFESQMSTVEAISGATADEMDRLSAKAEELGKTTQFTATEVGEAMEYMGMAGWKSGQMLSGVEGIMNLAAASGEELGMVSDIVTDALTAFGMKAEDSGRFADILAAAATNANTNVSMLGESFKYAAAPAGALGYSAEDVAIALGLMANAGIKADMAGTSLRNLFTRMAKPTKESSMAMDRLGLALYDDEGKMYSLREIMEQLRVSFKNINVPLDEYESRLDTLDKMLEDGILTQSKYDAQLEELNLETFGAEGAEKARAAAMLGGARAMSGLLAIANASEEDFNKLSASIDNSAGAAERMAQVRLDNLSGDVTIFKSALEGLEIAIFKKVSPSLRELVQYGTDMLGDLTRKLPGKIEKLVNGGVKALPNIKKNYERYLEPVLKGIGGVFTWILDHGDTVTSVLLGIGSALVAGKMVSNIVHLVTALSALAASPLALGIMGVGAAVGVVVGAVAKIKQHQRDLVDQSIAEHFGDLTLSLEELDNVADNIVGKGTLQELRTVLDQYAQLDEISKSIDSAADSLDKLDWMLSLGIKLSDSEQQEYQSQIDSYVASVREYIIQAWNAGSSATQSGFNDPYLTSVTTAWVNDYYSHQVSEFERLGTELSNAMTDAFEDGFLDFDESQKIAEIRAKMSRLQAELANSDFDKELRFAEQTNLGNLTAESFSDLLETVVEKETEIRKAASDVYVDAMAEATAGYKYEREQLQHVLEHSKDGEELAKAAEKLAMINKSYSELDGSAAAEELEKVGTAAEKVLSFGTNTLKEKYSGDLQSIIGQLVQEFDEEYLGGLDEAIKGTLQENGTLYGTGFHQALVDAIKNNPDAKGASELIDVLAPTVEDVEALAKKYEEAGIKMPEGFVSGMKDYDMLKALTGDEDAVYQQLLLYLSEEYPECREMLEAAIKEGENTVVKIAEGMENTEPLNSAAAKAADDAERFITDHFGRRNFTAEVNLELQYAISEDLSTVAAAEEKIAQRSKSLGEAAKTTKGKEPAKNAIGNIITSPTLSWVGEAGPEAIIPLNGSQRAQDLYNITGELMGMRGRFDGFSVSSGTTTTITYAPVINIAGNASKDDVTAALNEGYAQFKRFQQQYERETARTAWGRS
ncbi:MAG: phage tail tape measure protein [Blautia sp.]|nr:phage tail tape measure protein [Blautia sp.]